MTSVDIRTLLRREDGEFVPLSDVEQIDGDWDYVPGAICLTLDGYGVLTAAHWDDVNWLWPFVVQALHECALTGQGERSFPAQPLVFRAEVLTDTEDVQLSVTGTGTGVVRHARGPAAELYPALAHAGLEFFSDLRRLCPSGTVADNEISILESWL